MLNGLVKCFDTLTCFLPQEGQFGLRGRLVCLFSICISTIIIYVHLQENLHPLEINTEKYGFLFAADISGTLNWAGQMVKRDS